jgi:hypothetical protein
MKTEAAERMRSKLEKKLVPKLKAEIPKWAERLRFLHAQVLKWHEPFVPTNLPGLTVCGGGGEERGRKGW